MTTRHLTSGLVMLFASEGCVLRKKGSDPHSDIRQATVRATDLSDWEEVPVEDIPAYTKAEYDAKVSEMVRGRYSADEEFALQRKMIDALLNPAAMTLDDNGEPSTPGVIDEFNAYNTYVEQCKARAKDPALYTQPDDITESKPEDPASPEIIEAEVSMPDTLDPAVTDTPDTAATAPDNTAE